MADAVAAGDPDFVAGHDAEGSMIEEAQKALTELYEIHDYYFSQDKEEKRQMLQGIVERIAGLLDAAGEGANSAERAVIAFVRGRSLDAFEDYSAEAEEWLTKAVKLNPLSWEAWNAMGHCTWKKGNLPGAKNCFERAQDLQANKASLQNLSMLLRNLPVQELKERLANVQESVAKAKEALALDFADHHSWYVLGNAYCGVFFQVTHRLQDLDKACQAYSRAVANGGESNPDLYFNRGNVRRYRGEYAEAIADYRTAGELDPTLPTEDSIADVERFLARAAELVEKRGRLKPKRATRLVESLRLPELALPESLESATLSSLEDGDNDAKVLSLRVLMPLSTAGVPPESFLAMDGEGTCMVLAIYNIRREASAGITDRNLVQVLSPRVRTVRYRRSGPAAPVEDKENRDELAFPCVSVATPENVLVDGKALQASFAASEATFANFDT